MSSTNDQKIKLLFEGLGKSTKRGIRKCPKCGTCNGTRGVFCKNVVCDAQLKTSDEHSHKDLIIACRLLTDDNTQIYSVRIKDKGPDKRGFVQLPLNSSSDNLCFIEECPKIFQANVLKCHEKTPLYISLSCQHIEAAKKCMATGTAISMNPIIIDSMNLLPNIKDGLWDLMSSDFPTPGPVVQRISRSVFVVKCKPSPEHPLGYLHVKIYNDVKHKDKPAYRHHCTCPVENKEMSSIGNSINEKKCVHYYALICSFASDDKLSQEFQHFFQSEQVQTLYVNQYFSNEDSDQLVAIFDNVDAQILNDADNVNMSAQELDPTVELIASESDINNVYTYLTLDESNPIITLDETTFDVNKLIKLNVINNNNNINVGTNTSNTIQHCDKPSDSNSNSNKLDKIIDLNSLTTAPVKKIFNIDNNNEFKSKKRKNNNEDNNDKLNKKRNRRIRLLDGKQPTNRIIDEETKLLEDRSFEYLRWIASISERIYTEMHFGFDCSKPRTLIFPTPMNFFECLKERIAKTRLTKRRLPNSTIAVISKKPPIGTFTKFIWQLTSIIHVKQVFDNPYVPLKVTRSFIENPDGTYTPYEPPPEDLSLQSVGKGLQRLKPTELLTYLDVGKTSPTQFEPTPFTIEFTSDILPISKIGELKIIFKYGTRRPSSSK